MGFDWGKFVGSMILIICFCALMYVLVLNPR